MSLLLLSVFGVVAIAVLAMAQPDARNLASIKIGAVGLVLAVVCATFWHEHVVAVVAFGLAVATPCAYIAWAVLAPRAET